MSHARPVAWARLPRAGLGNMLYVWARAVAFARLNAAELHVSGWSSIRLGPILRGERSWRMYVGAFRRPSLVSRARLLAVRLARAATCDPPLRPIEPGEKSRLFVFEKMGDSPTDPFRELIPWRAEIMEEFTKMLSGKTRARLAQLQASVVGIHVRRGDFKRTGWVTPIDYFCRRLADIRAAAGADIPATVFSDGSDEELAALLALPAVQRSPRQSEVLDLIQLSTSRVIVMSRGSTFGMMAGFLSDGVLIRDPEWNYGDSRPREINSQVFEGGPALDAAQWPELLRANLRALHQHAKPQGAEVASNFRLTNPM